MNDLDMLFVRILIPEATIVLLLIAACCGKYLWGNINDND